MIIKNKKELEVLREGGKRLAAVLIEVAWAAKDGVTTKELDELAEKLILKSRGKPSFKGYGAHRAPMPYPGTICISINEEVVHGIVSDRKLKNGDVVGLDIGMWYEGLCTDTAMTVLVGGGTNKLIETTKKSLKLGIAQVRPGARLGDIGFAIQQHLEKEGFGVVRELVGHGVGRAVHEEPEIPNWGRKGEGNELFEGMVIALEPMATEGSPKVKLAKDGWTWVTRDGSRSAHFEHTLVVTKTGSEVLTKI
ncbi:type I methionyl aminopeptidase [Candidatus Giovannonibacteria bacterium RIFCSPHIGHO2_02_43_13]|uniref:Methionine aminopeptidase n=1 Tax=Candidatus Giovannonibacteria bacterium RIFCSPHIGHO2_02_43_13 TaxID=1798330 RepID=A0A1F5WUT1_9BACT|nr:MAG: type I methionyl aminopeptidase [Candidatus Giovannonibacteria bacterium RIFCSPHIGHO2_12_FULL_44_42]OGF79396.1 MAG: type I methionyl aminopeptidase [Candidatus Giovannonibacteria bacterium RIFCSPHIGHO2_02_43_13]OGF89903.1 MAG: type I methionyl aminopeptidase [Candidatus Giovannonibacteria bacterium RIFCSPLOWO2_02_FULL_43_54]OGF97363.1 MAG: type I methionyl aminopeptidase [Candidatus Giovannonibacteria bacterium RIFCSPLOWO2_12_FULL_44_32]